MNLVEKVVSAGLCSGCGLCESIAPKGAITIRMTQSGYLRPLVNERLSSDTETSIAGTCPGIQVAHDEGCENYDVSWGPLRSVQVGYAADPEVRRMGSSGGVISALCINLLESGEVDFVAQIAVSTIDPIANELQISRTRDDVIRAAGSRYAPSAPLKTLRELLATGERFAFVGKPCDVAALRAYMRLNPSARTQIPYLLSFMCAGIPSEHGTEEVIKAMGADRSKLRRFRYRGDGWPGMARAEHFDGTSYEMDYNSSWGEILGKQLQFRCKVCADGTGEFADLVCADAWYGKDGYPDFTDRDGRSLILVRTDAGAKLLEKTIENLAAVVIGVSVDEISLMQPYQLNRKRLVAARSVATLLATGRVVRFRRLSLVRAAMHAGVVNLLRNAWGTYKRIKKESTT